LLTGNTAEGHQAVLARSARLRESGADIWAQVSSRKTVFQIHMNDPFVLGSLPAFSELVGGSVAGRWAAYADPEWRRRARSEIGMRGAFRSGDWGRVTIEETGVETLDGSSPAGLDELLDVAIEHPSARFRFALFNDDEDGVAELLKSPVTHLGLSDAGAHVSQLCDAGYATELMGKWVREKGVLTLEHAVWRLTGHQAEVLGLSGRGRIEPGAVADVVVFDPEQVACGALRRLYDLPAGRDRLVADSCGVEHVLVNGMEVWRRGRLVATRGSGTILRK
jgi:N-acyl-D-aspartate/D-glutamate deacylase